MREFTENDLREMVLRLAHQIRNPLATIKSGIQLVQHLLDADGEIKEYLGAALVEVERINRTVVDMQRMIRLDAATAKARPVADVVSEALERCAGQAEASSITLENRGGPPSMVLADSSQLLEAVAELLCNAIEFSPAGSRVRIGWTTAGDHLVRIDVSDSCGGIPPSAAERILRPFYSTSTRRTGLGLNIVQRICELGGGRLEWKNLSDRSGCQFSVVMPKV